MLLLSTLIAVVGYAVRPGCVRDLNAPDHYHDGEHALPVLWEDVIICRLVLPIARHNNREDEHML